ncbi:MAG: hypothetical protein L6R36_003540 [Xanthoria steineri]|nr:MAG: hypothetical protein L6R36_003540 [Xanthoria steineri]
MSSPTPTPDARPANDNGGGGGGGNNGPTSSPLLFFVALGFGVVFTNLWIIVGVKYCFRYNQRNRRQQHDENGEPIDMTTMPRTHRRRREKKLMTMEEVNERFPLTKYKAWMATRAEEGLSTAGGVAVPHTPTAIAPNVDAATSSELDGPTSHDRGPTSPSSSAPQDKEKIEKEAANASKSSMDKPAGQNTTSPSKDHLPSQQSDDVSSKPPQTSEIGPKPPPATPTTNPPAAPTRQEIQDDNDMDDDDQIQIAVPTEMLNNPGDSCAICIDTLEDDDDVRGLSCGHAFHASCLDPWLTSRRACCPLCKADFYVPKPRAEGDVATDGERNAGRRPQGMAGARIDGGRPHHYTFMNRRDGRPRMLLPGRFMAMGHFDDSQSQRYGFPTAPRQARTSDRNQEQHPDAPEVQTEQPNTWRSRLPTLSVPRPSFPARFRRSNAPSGEAAPAASAPETIVAATNPTPGQLEAGHRG